MPHGQRGETGLAGIQPSSLLGPLTAKEMFYSGYPEKAETTRQDQVEEKRIRASTDAPRGAGAARGGQSSRLEVEVPEGLRSCSCFLLRCCPHDHYGKKVEVGYQQAGLKEAI